MSKQVNCSLTISGWRIGFNKVEFTKMLKAEFGLGLTDAKTITDRILNQELVELQVDLEGYERIAKRATDLGAVVVQTEVACR